MAYYDTVKQELSSLLEDFNRAKSNLDALIRRNASERQQIEAAKEMVKQLARERQCGFPALAKAYDEFFQLQDKQLVNFLAFKDKAAVRAAEIVSEYAKVRRLALKEKKVYQYLVDYYESICPFLIELREEELGDITEEDREIAADYSEEERSDEAIQFLSKEEYRKLPAVERNQIALDRYWKRSHSKWHIGKMYERYVGYLYEKEGYEIDYIGIFKGLEDLGRDIIASKGNKIVVAQCKNWSRFRTIYEKHIFQFFGTVFQYRDENKGKTIEAVFYSTTKLSDLARRFGQELGIELQESFKMDKSYPCIKCNVSRVDGAKIYHLPFDQQYDNVKVEKNHGEFYCKTTAEAENKGFRRAYRYKGLPSRK